MVTIKNVGLLEVYKTVLLLYQQKLIKKNDIKELIHSLKVLADNLSAEELTNLDS
jgi:hypothetical protein